MTLGRRCSFFCYCCNCNTADHSSVTGFSPETRKIIRTRAKDMCERCTSAGHEIHHRRPRGMGGSKNKITNSPANGVLLCADCHRWIESNRIQSRENGWLVRQGEDPCKVLVRYKRSIWVYLTNYGGFTWP